LCEGLLKPALIQALREYDEAHEGNDCELQSLYDADNGDVNLGDDEEHDEMLGEGGLPQRGDDNGAGDSESVSSFSLSGIGLLLAAEKGNCVWNWKFKGPR